MDCSPTGCPTLTYVDQGNAGFGSRPAVQFQISGQDVASGGGRARDGHLEAVGPSATRRHAAGALRGCGLPAGGQSQAQLQRRDAWPVVVMDERQLKPATGA